eukprot:12916265-Prorocentrum_lima.AAC.1
MSGRDQRDIKKEAVPPPGFNMNNANTTWDIVDMVSIIMEILIVDTDAGKCWRINLHAPASKGQHDAEQQ